jgi:hypothetical protein
MFDPERDDDECDLWCDARPQVHQVVPRDVTGTFEALAQGIGGSDAVRHEQRVGDGGQPEDPERDRDGGTRQAMGQQAGQAARDNLVGDPGDDIGVAQECPYLDWIAPTATEASLLAGALLKLSDEVESSR